MALPDFTRRIALALAAMATTAAQVRTAPAADAPHQALGRTEVWRERNFGLIEIDWSHGAPKLRVEIRDEKGARQLTRTVDTGLLRTA
jgi:hypothetical protein